MARDALDLMIEQALNGGDSAAVATADPLDAMIERELAAMPATPNLSPASPNLALPAIPSNLGTTTGALGYMGQVVRAVRPEQERNWLSDLGVGLMQGLPDAARQVGGVMGMAGTLLDTPDEMMKNGGMARDLQSTGRVLTEQARGVSQALPQTQGLGGDVGRAIPGVAGTIGLGVLTGGAGPVVATGVGMASAGAQQAGSVYNDALDRMGNTAPNRDSAALQALSSGTITAATSFIPIGRVLGPIAQKMSGKIAPAIINRAMGRLSKNVAMRLGADGVLEMAQEGSDAAQEMFLQYVYEEDPNAFNDWQQKVGRSALVGGILGTGSGVVSEIGSRNAGNQNNPVRSNQAVSRAGGPLPLSPNGVADQSGVVGGSDAAMQAATQPGADASAAGVANQAELTDADLSALSDDEYLRRLREMENPDPQSSAGSGLPASQPLDSSSTTASTSEQVRGERSRFPDLAVSVSSVDTPIRENLESGMLDRRTFQPAPSLTEAPQGNPNTQSTELIPSEIQALPSGFSPSEGDALYSQKKPQDVAQGVASETPDDVVKYLRGMEDTTLRLVRDSIESGTLPKNQDYHELVRDLIPFRAAVEKELGRRPGMMGFASVRGLEESSALPQRERSQSQIQEQAGSLRPLSSDTTPVRDTLNTDLQRNSTQPLPATDSGTLDQQQNQPHSQNKPKPTEQRGVSVSSPNSTPDLAELSKRSGAAVTLADSAKLTETERSVTKRLGSLGRSVVWVDTDGPARGAVVGRTPTTIYLRRGMGNVRLAPIALHEVMHSARRTNRELADELVSVFGRDKVLARGREELWLQAEAGVDVAGSEDAAIDEGLAGLLEDAANENADLRQRIIETPGLLDRLRVWLKQTLANLAGKGSQEVRHAMRLLDQLEAQARKESNSRAEKSIEWARSQSGVKRKIDDAYNSGSASALQGEYDRLENMNNSFMEDNSGQSDYSPTQLFSFPEGIPEGVKNSVSPRELISYGFRTNVENAKGEEAFNALGAARYWEIVKAAKQLSQRSERTNALRKAQEPEARFVAAYSDLLGGKPPTKPKQAARVSELQGGDIIRIEGQASRVIEDENGKSLMGGAFDGLSVDGIEAIPVDVGARGWWRVDSGTAEPADAPKEQAADIPFSARKLELRSEQQQGMLNFTSGWAAPKQSKEPPLSAKEKAELYPGIRAGETVSQYEKRMGTADTKPLFSSDMPKRAKPKNAVVFDKPITGPTGAQVLSYEWVWTWENVETKDDVVERRVSDWSLAENNESTGRDIVHQFGVRLPNGDMKTMSLESAIRALGFGATTANPLKSSASSLKTLAKNKMELASVEARLKPLQEARDSAEAMRFPSEKMVRSEEPVSIAHLANDDVRKWVWKIDGDEVHWQYQRRGEPEPSRPNVDNEALAYEWRRMQEAKILGKKDSGVVSRYELGTLKGKAEDLRRRIDKAQRTLGVSESGTADTPVMFSAKLPEKIDVDGVQKPTTNSRGKPIAQTENAVRNFYRWFGNSKAVDASGRPLVLYHGTKADFNYFRKSKKGYFGAGVYLTSEPSDAGSYALKDTGDDNWADGANTKPVYAKIERLASEKDVANLKESAPEQFDGGVFYRDHGYGGGADNYVVYDEANVKSATGNRGDFDREIADIRFSARLPDTIDVDGKQRPTTNSDGKPIARTAEEVRNFWRWFADSKVVDKDGKPLVVYRGDKYDVYNFESQKRREHGVFTTPQKNIAKIYAGPNDPKAIYIRASKLLDLTEDTRQSRKWVSKWSESFDDWTDRTSGEVVDAFDVLASGQMFDFEGNWSGERWNDIQATAEADGYEAVILPDFDSAEGVFPSIVVFDSRSIKSATGNKGTFDAENPDIRFSAKRERLRGDAFKEKMQDAKRAAKIEREGADAARKEHRNTIKNREKREKAFVTLVQQQQAENAQLSVQLGDASAEIQARRSAMKSMLGVITDAQKQIRVATFKLEKAANKAEAAKAVQETAAKARDAVVEIAKQLPPSLRGRMLADVRDAADIADLIGDTIESKTKAGARASQTFGALGKAADLLIRYNGREAKADIVKMTRPRAMGKLSEKARKQIREVVKDFDSLYRQTQAPLAPASRADAAEQLVKMADDVRAIVRAHQLENKIIRWGRIADAMVVRGEVVKAVSAASPELPFERKNPQSRAQPSVFKRGFLLNDRRADVLMRLVDNDPSGNGPLATSVERPIREGQDKKYELIESVTNISNEFAKDAGFEDIADLRSQTSGTLGEGLQKFETVKIGGKDYRLSWGSIAKLVSSFDDVLLGDRLRRGRPVTFRGRENQTPIKLTAADEKALRDALPPEVYQVVKGMKRLRDQTFPLVQAAQRVVSGREAPAQPGYEPIATNRDQAGFGAEVDPFTADFETKLIENSGFLKERVDDTSTPIIIGDFFQDFDTSIRNAADAAFLMIPLRNAREVLMKGDGGKSEIANAISERFGEAAIDRIREAVRGVVKPPPENNAFARTLNKIERNTKVSLTAINPSSLTISAVAPLPRVIAEIGLARTLKGMRSLGASGSRAKMFAESPWIRSRAAGTVTNINSMLPQINVEPVDMELDGTMRERLGEVWKATKRGGRAWARNMLEAAKDFKAGDIGEGLKNTRQAFTRGSASIAEQIRLQSYIDSKIAQIVWEGTRVTGESQADHKRKAEDILLRILPRSDSFAQTAWSEMVNRSGASSVFPFRSDANTAINHLTLAWHENRGKGLKVTGGLLAAAMLSALIKGADSALRAALSGDDEDAVERAKSAALLRFGQETVGMPFMGSVVFDLVREVSAPFGAPMGDSIVLGPVSKVAGGLHKAGKALADKIAGQDAKKVDSAMERLIDGLLQVVEGAGTATKQPGTGLMPYVRAGVKGASE